MKVNDIFASICGEGPTIGIPALFIRLYGCNLSCDFCDAKQDRFVEMSRKEMINKILSEGMMNVCWTGGEPAMQFDDIIQTIESLQLSNENNFPFFHFIETNGILINEEIIYENLEFLDLYIVSPKSKKIADVWIERIEENAWLHGIVKLKFVIDDIFEIPESLKRSGITFYVQPKLREGEDPLRKYVKLTNDFKKIHEEYRGITMLPQLHKIIGVK